MASNYTANFGLCQWEATDQVLRTEFNEDNAKIDAVLGELSDTSEAHTAAIEEYATAIPKLGNCQIYVTSYSGNGKYGAANPTTLTFPHKPVLMMVFTGTHRMLAFLESGWAMTFVNSTGSTSGLTCTRTGNTVSWYSTVGAVMQMSSNYNYKVVAFLDATS